MLYLLFVCGDAYEVRITISRTHIGVFPQGSVHSSWGSVSLGQGRRVGGGSEGGGWVFAPEFLKCVNMFSFFCSSHKHKSGPLLFCMVSYFSVFADPRITIWVLQVSFWSPLYFFLLFFLFFLFF